MSDNDLIKREDVVFLLDTFIAEYGKELIAELGDTEELMSTKELASIVTDIVMDILTAVKVIPSAAVKPVVKGEWLTSNIPNEKYVCSNCSGACWYYDAGGEVAQSRFRPNCGAVMREEVNDD